MKDLYQFNLDFNGHYIKGYKISEIDNFIQIENPEFHCGNLHNINPIDNIIMLSKESVVCYFKTR